MTEKILFICGSLNQTKMLHQIAEQLAPRYECYFSPYYADGLIDRLARWGLLGNTVLGGRHQQDTLDYLHEHDLEIDWRGKKHWYDLVVTGSDLIVPKNVRWNRLVLVQEGITEPETWLYHLVKWLKLPRWLANTATTGLSDLYDVFCVGSQGYREHFIRKGVNPAKIAVTGMPNFDHFAQFRDNKFPYFDYALVATTPLRETFRLDDRKRFLNECARIANGRQLIFKLHPLENEDRARKEINSICPGALVITEGSVDEMIANAEVVITQLSTCTFTAVALEKEVHSYLDLAELQSLMPIQNKGASAERIARICRQVLHTPLPVLKAISAGFRSHPGWEQDL
ncbi:MAG: hypothetical protein JW757_01010 [Anaerolineales bacterium]|nr:hypothetical protein [Anaerolineales bacterium]